MISQKSGHIVFDVKVFPRSSKNKVIVSGEDISVKIKSPPAEGLANRELIRFFSDLLSISRKSISILRGLSSRNKVIKAEGIDREDFLNLLIKNMEKQ